MIRLKIILTIVASIILLITTIYMLSSTILLQSYSDIENTQTTRDINRVRSAVENYSDTLNIKLRDWAQWDDSYQFVQDSNEEFIEANLADSTLINLEVDLLVYLSTQNEIVYSHRVDFMSKEHLSSEGLVHTIVETYGSEIPNDLGEKLSGIMETPEGLIFVEILPITTTSGDGPIFGSILFGRFLDDSMIEKFSDLTQLSIEISPFDSLGQPQDVALAKENLSENVTDFIHPLSEESIAGYFLLDEVRGGHVAILRLTIPRETYIQGEKTVFLLELISGISIVLIGGIIISFLETIVLRRLTRLSGAVKKISPTNLQNVSLPTTKNDEIGRLTTIINELMFELSRAQTLERKAQEVEHLMAEGMKKGLESTQKINKLLVNRELKMVELK